MTGLDTIAMFSKYLRSLERWIGKAQEYAAARAFDPEVLVAARLAPDQFAFVRQIQAACDTAKLSASKLAGVEPPSHPDTEKTIDELKARLHTCLAYLEGLGPDKLAGSEERAIQHTWMQGKHMRGADYIAHYAIPNFLFHIVTAYDILRHGGVPLGKMDFLRPMPLEG